MPSNDHKYKIGQLVTVKNWGKAYSKYTSWFAENNVEYLRNKFTPNYFLMAGGYPQKDKIFRVVAIGKHCAYDVTMYAIQSIAKLRYGNKSQIFLIDEVGLQQCDVESEAVI